MFKIREKEKNTKDVYDLQMDILTDMNSDKEGEQIENNIWYMTVFMYEYIKYVSAYHKASDGEYEQHHHLPSIVYKLGSTDIHQLKLRPFDNCKEAIEQMIADFEADAMFVTYPHYTLYIDEGVDKDEIEQHIGDIIADNNANKLNTVSEKKEILKKEFASRLGIDEGQVDILKLISSTIVINGIPLFTISSSEKFWERSTAIETGDSSADRIVSLFADNPHLLPTLIQDDNKKYHTNSWYMERAEGVHFYNISDFYDGYIEKFNDLPQA